ncbi:TrmH family RNA methyltransferase [Faecalicoccus pleomorphus]|uniref:tRNA (Guanosine-2'-O-)-methyltransferase, TrmH family n=1 Tax=Faecalicoccus pleomorphus TaxID=1323 RepID=A0A380LJK8_9FIRM|nr:TrmH family RNA methyltransferase [Faecalicoccus pleomorphus]MBM6808489.1 RNA methyltransferase [Faecalicoccus pleomorphus]SUO03521.1 tRNA (Guanosine-2'-O-)-methyltransferase, TrmH family [Faecalicoccus pleomorphus]
MELLFEGKISVKAILENQKRDIFQVIMEQGKRNKDFGYVYYLAKQRNIPVSYQTKEEIQTMASSSTHGGLLVKAGVQHHPGLPDHSLSGFLCHIDGIEDPYNLGSICRSLYAAGCNGLILMERDWSKVEPLILKASAGAFEHLSIYWIQKEEDLIYYLKQHAIPLVMAHRKDAISLYDYTFPENFCLALGGALRGISAQLAEHSTQNIFLEYGRDCRYALDTASTVSAFGFEIVRQRRK